MCWHKPIIPGQEIQKFKVILSYAGSSSQPGLWTCVSEKKSKTKELLQKDKQVPASPWFVGFCVCRVDGVKILDMFSYQLKSKYSL